MKKYTYQGNNGIVEVILETEDGFEWICDCGKVTHSKSWENAKMICNALNG